MYFYLFFSVSFSPKVEVLEKQQYQALVEKGYVVIDVRTPEEYDEGHIGGAKNINVKSEVFVTEIKNFQNPTPFGILPVGERSYMPLK